MTLFVLFISPIWTHLREGEWKSNLFCLVVCKEGKRDKNSVRLQPLGEIDHRPSEFPWREKRNDPQLFPPGYCTTLKTACQQAVSIFYGILHRKWCSALNSRLYQNYWCLSAPPPKPPQVAGIRALQNSTTETSSFQFPGHGRKLFSLICQTWGSWYSTWF